MRIAELNTCDYGSTGNVMLQTAKAARDAGINVTTFSPKKRAVVGDRSGHIYIGNTYERLLHRVLCKYTGLNGCFSVVATTQFIRKLKKINPDIIHLHNIHNCYVNLPMLFRYIKKNNILTVWTLHDCWSFTGQCPHFQIVGCDKWKSGCYNCTQYRLYPSSYVDRTKSMWKLKRKWFTDVKNMILVSPSMWLANLVKMSYMKDYTIKVIYNGVDTNVFKPVQGNFKEKNKIFGYMVLGVAFDWGKRKGLDVFIGLSEILDPSYTIVLVGVNDEISNTIPKNIVTVNKTHDQRQLAEIYTAADVFLNPTREEVLGMVNLEALACGTPVITSDAGGSPECIDSRCGEVVNCGDLNVLKERIYKVCTEKLYSENDCISRAEKFNVCKKYREYIELYRSAYRGE